MNDLFDIYAETIRVLEEKTQALVTEYQPYMQCRKGCSGCCVDGFKIRYVEAVDLLKGFAELPTETAAQVLKQIHDPTAEEKVRCPFLVDGGCSVYATRPSLCRAFGLIVQLKDKLGSCELNFQDFPDDVSMKALDLKPYYEVLDDLSERLWAGHPLDESSEVPRLSIRNYLLRLLTPQAEASETVELSELAQR